MESLMELSLTEYLKIHCPKDHIRLSGKGLQLRLREYRKEVAKATAEYMQQRSSLVSKRGAEGALLNRPAKIDTPEVLLDSSHYLYMLLSECGGMLKVGITQDVQQRMKQLSSATPFEFKLVGFIKLSSKEQASSLEALAHRKFDHAKFDCKFNGFTEWLYYSEVITSWFMHNANKHN